MRLMARRQRKHRNKSFRASRMRSTASHTHTPPLTAYSPPHLLRTMYRPKQPPSGGFAAASPVGGGENRHLDFSLRFVE